MKKNRVLLWLMAVSLFSCTSIQKSLQKDIKASEVFQRASSGVVIYDLQSQKKWVDINGQKYFTPASNVKIFTLSAALELDSIASLKYVIRNDSLIFWGCGDPTLLHPDFQNTAAIDFLKGRKEKLFYSTQGILSKGQGFGWAWDDYSDYYAAERNDLPLYGNTVRIKKDSSFQIIPPVFEKSFHKQADLPEPKRQLEDNVFFYGDSLLKAQTWLQDIPYKVSSALTQQLLIDTLKKNVTVCNFALPVDHQTIYGVKIDSTLRKMMYHSDNFIAEQMLLNSQFVKHQSTSTEEAIKQQMPQPPIKWVDGSGLSRYNLFSPADMIEKLRALYEKYPEEVLFTFFPAGGRNGTLAKYFKNSTPYLYAKTGSFSGVYCLSGYLKTSKNKTLAISFLTNNYPGKVSDIRKELEKILYNIYLKN